MGSTVFAPNSIPATASSTEDFTGNVVILPPFTPGKYSSAGGFSTTSTELSSSSSKTAPFRVPFCLGKTLIADCCDFLIEKSPNWGLKWRKNLGLGFEFPARKLNSADMVMGASIGDPKCPIPDFTMTENGFDGSFGRYAIRNAGPVSKNVPRPKHRSFESPAAMLDWKGKPRILRGTLALKRGFLCSSLNFREAFIFWIR
uniref:Uncharacterized protein n=1 Tax=Opuntia streptacantha TaxID=393608 RepID=A0A7C9DMU4_OPUST